MNLYEYDEISLVNKFNKMNKPTKEEIKNYMELHNNDEVGENDQWDMEDAEYNLLLNDKYYYKEEKTKVLK